MIVEGAADFRKQREPNHDDGPGGTSGLSAAGRAGSSRSLYMTPMRRSRVRTVLAVLFGFFTLNAWVQAALSLFGSSDDPAVLTALQVAIGVAGGFAAAGSWRGARWAPVAALVYGATTGGMLVALPFILRLEPEARGGIWAGAAGVVLVSLAAAWYLRRNLTTDQAAAD